MRHISFLLLQPEHFCSIAGGSDTHVSLWGWHPLFGDFAILFFKASWSVICHMILSTSWRFSRHHYLSF